MSFSKQMKAVAFLIVLFTTVTVNAQNFILSGKVVNSNQEPLVGATIAVKELKKGTSSDFEGNFQLKLSKGIHTLQVSYVGFKTLVQEINVTNNQQTTFLLTSGENVLDEVLVSAVRVKADAPVTHSNLTKAEISKRNLGQDIPSLINFLPSVVTTSDAGAGIGYTGIRVRGSDASRVNVTINGIPYNDSESQGTFWVNMGDFASSTESLQLQRGVGTSTNGSGAFGASLNILTGAVSKEAGGEISNSFGSFGTRKHTVKFTTGKVNEHFEFAGRLSEIHSDGYVDRAFTNLSSYFLQGSYTDENTLIKALIFGNKEKTYLSWNGVTEDKLDSDRTYNPSGKYTDGNGNTQFYDNESDNYWQDHYQLHWNEKLTDNWSTNIGINYTRGKGYFEQYEDDTDKISLYNGIVVATDTKIKDGKNIPITDLIRRRWLDNHFYVLNANTTYKKGNLEIIGGTSFSYYKNDHYGEVIWAKEFSKNANIRDRYYFGDASKTDYSTFIKSTFSISDNFKAFVDLQGRFVNYKTGGISSKRKPFEVNKDFNFFNPKVGLTYIHDSNHSLYGSYARANREPNREDFKNGTDTHETLNDFEFGWRFKSDNIKINTNLFYMNYVNQLVLTGAVNDVGTPIRTSSGQSYRAGIEIDANITLTEKISLKPNFAFSKNKNVDFYVTKNDKAVKLGDTPISYSPEIVAGNLFTFNASKILQVSLLSKYVGEQFLNNINDQTSKLKGYFLNDFNIVYEIPTKKIVKSIVFSGLVNNIFNVKYESNAADYGGGYIVYFPQAGTNFLLGATLKF